MIMAGKSDVDRIISRLSDYNSDRSLAEGFVSRFAELWAHYGSKKYMGKKGKKLINEGIQEFYVMLESSKDRVDDLDNVLKRRMNTTDVIHDPISIRASDSIQAERSKMESIEEKFRFLSMLKSIWETLEDKDSRLLYEIDKMLEDQKTMEFYKQSTRNEIRDHESNLRQMDDLQTYVETLMDRGKAQSAFSDQEHESKNRDESDTNDHRKVGVL